MDPPKNSHSVSILAPTELHDLLKEELTQLIYPKPLHIIGTDAKAIKLALDDESLWLFASYCRTADAMRVNIDAPFVAMNWNQLKHHLETLKCGRYIPRAWSDTAPLEIHTVSNASVLYHTGAITERVSQFFNEEYRTKKLRSDVPVPRLFTRVFNNKFSISAEITDSMHMRFSLDPLATKDIDVDQAKDRKRLLAIKAHRAVAEEEAVNLDPVDLPKPENTKYNVFTQDPMLLSSDDGYLVKPKWMSIAPMRETTAAALLMETRWNFFKLDQAKASEDQQNQEDEITVWDPFCGSGTFLIEAAQLFLRAQTAGLFPPIHFTERRLGFKYWPTFDEKAYNSFINRRQQALQALLLSRRNKDEVALSKKFTGPKIRLVGSDINRYCVAMSQINTQSMKKMVCSHFDGEMKDLVSEWMDSKVSFEYIASDFQFIDRYTTFNWPKTHIIANPPWGHRLGDSSMLHRVFPRFMRLLKQKKELKEVFLVNGSQELHRMDPAHLKWKSVFKFSARGLPVQLLKLLV